MTLWNIIRDFFVQYVFGGTDSAYVPHNNMFFGNINYYLDGALDDMMMCSTQDITLIFGTEGTYQLCISYGDWLSTTATIITLVGLFIAITLLIISLFKWIVRLVSLRG